jgi:hypothetical protein
MDTRNGRLRSPKSVVLLVAALALTVVVAAGVVLLRELHVDAESIRGEPMTDAQAAGQVVAAAKQIVSTAQLQDVTAGYAFMSCKNENEPPYQAAIYMNFQVPQNNSAKYLNDVGASLVAHGWHLAPAMGEHFGQKLTKDGVTAIFYRNVNDTVVATMRLYGECRNAGDHRNDNPVWTEVTDQLG